LTRAPGTITGTRWDHRTVDILGALLVVCALFVLGSGAMAATTGRMPMPWLAGRTPRPRLWGLGQFLFGLMVLFQAYCRIMDVSPDTRLVLSTTGFVLVLIGFGFIFAGTRRIRRP
jgi:hypothetical protein